jgi:hypothetical protein
MQLRDLISTRVLNSFVVLLAAAILSAPLRAQAPPAGTNPAQAVWDALSQPAFDPAKIATVYDLEIVRDRIRITLHSGTLHFTQPINGLVTGAVFSGDGRIQMSPPTPQESQQLQLFVKADGVNLPFTEAVFSFTDKTFDEISAKVTWGGATPVNDAIYATRMQQNEDLGAAFLPRLFKSVMATDRTKSALFVADMKTAEHGWVNAMFDASTPEEVSIGKWTDVGAIKFFDTWMSFPAGGRSASDAFNVPGEKADYAIRTYKIDANATAGSELIATAKVEFETRWPGERVLLFSLDSNLRVDKVSDAQGSPLTFFESREQKDRFQSYGDYLAVVLPAPLEVNKVSTLTFHYAGKRVITQVGPGNYFAQSFGWYPTRLSSRIAGDEFAGRYDFEMTFHCPKRYILVATGNKVSETFEGGDRVTQWKSDLPLAVAGFAYGDYKVVTEKVGEIEVQVFANIQPDEQMADIQRRASEPGVQVAVGSLSTVSMAPTIATEMGNSIRTFQRYFGPYPYKQLAIANISANYGQGWPGLIYLSVFTFMDPTQIHAFFGQNTPRLTEFFRAHETSHQWWGHRVGWKSYHDQWMSEGFATFSGNLYTQLRDNQKEYLDRLRADKQGLLARDAHSHVFDSVGSVWMGYRTSNSVAPGDTSTIIYNKGGYILTMLRMMMSDPNPKSTDPDARFKLMMQDFCKTFDNKPASTEDFKAVAEKFMTPGMDQEGNHKLDWFFRQYVYGTGIPRYEFHYDVKDAGGGQWTVTGTLKRTGVPDTWIDMVPLFMQREGKMVRFAFINAKGSDTQIDFKLPINPGKLLVNVNEELLAEIKQ